MHAGRRSVALLLVAFAAAGLADPCSQEPPAPAPQEKPQDPAPPDEPADDPEADPPADDANAPKERKRARRKREKKPPPEKKAEPKQVGEPAKVVDCKALGATIETLQFADAAAGEDGRRLEFGPIPPGTAFEVWLEGQEPRRIYVTEPVPGQADATQQVQKPVVSLLRVTDDEWGQYVAFLEQDQDQNTMVGDPSTFLTVVATVMLQQKAVVLAYRDDLPSIEKRAAAAFEKLARGIPFDQVVRTHTEDEVARSSGGLLMDDTRGAVLASYPFSKAIFEMQPGEVCGPIYNKTAAYIIHVDRITEDANPRFNKVRASAITLKYSTGSKVQTKDLGVIHDSVRVRTDAERFKRLLPPGIQVPPPATFGPDDIAPVGNPDAKLKNGLDSGP
jgi:hypothetical protein